MHLHLLTVGTRLPAWINAGVAEYLNRLPAEYRVQLHEIPVSKRSKTTDITRAVREEGVRMLAAVPAQAEVIALEVTGRAWSTEQLADTLADWQQNGRDIALCIGGPDGLAPEVRERATRQWSLSPLTLPHGLVRIIVAEQLYRAWSILHNHPYHRA